MILKPPGALAGFQEPSGPRQLQNESILIVIRALTTLIMALFRLYFHLHSFVRRCLSICCTVRQEITHTTKLITNQPPDLSSPLPTPPLKPSIIIDHSEKQSINQSIEGTNGQAINSSQASSSSSESISRRRQFSRSSCDGDEHCGDGYVDGGCGIEKQTRTGAHYLERIDA